MKLKRALFVVTTSALLIAGFAILDFAPPLSAQSGQLQGGVQQNSTPGDVVSGQTYSDQFSTSCSQGNTSPYIGMDPLSCHGVMAPTDSRGGCSLGGMRVFKKVGNTCYYCSPINPPIDGIIIPYDQVGWASRQGYRCGVDQADPDCMAVCSGGQSYTPPSGQPGPGPQGIRPPAGVQGYPDTPRYPGPPLVAGAKNPCQPFGPGGYDYCANPTQPPGCVCPAKGQLPSDIPKYGTPNNGPCPTPDWARQYKAEGADPPLRYGVGFNQGMAHCLESQCTLQNLTLAIWNGAFLPVRAVLGVAQAAMVIDAVVHPPGFSTNPDPYMRGREEGERLCNWLLRLAPLAARALPKRPPPLIGRSGIPKIPPNFNFRQAIGSIRTWLPKINPSGCDRNCGVATANSVRVLFGRPLEPAPTTKNGMTDGEMEGLMGMKFTQNPLTGPDMSQYLGKMPEGTVAVVSAENPNFSGQLPSGPVSKMSPNDVPGHFFFAVKMGELDFWDGQSGGPQMALPGGWIYRVMIVGNPLYPQ